MPDIVLALKMEEGLLTHRKVAICGEVDGWDDHPILRSGRAIWDIPTQCHTILEKETERMATCEWCGIVEIAHETQTVRNVDVVTSALTEILKERFRLETFIESSPQVPVLAPSCLTCGSESFVFNATIAHDTHLEQDFVHAISTDGPKPYCRSCRTESAPAFRPIPNHRRLTLIRDARIRAKALKEQRDTILSWSVPNAGRYGLGLVHEILDRATAFAREDIGD